MIGSARNRVRHRLNSGVDVMATQLLSWNSVGPTPTPTPTLGMRLSCNFVNVYTIAYRIQYTFTRVHACIPNTHLARKSSRVGQVGGQVGEDRRACPARGKLNGEVAGHADFRASILARKSVRMSVSVSWNSSFYEHVLQFITATNPPERATTLQPTVW